MTWVDICDRHDNQPSLNLPCQSLWSIYWFCHCLRPTYDPSKRPEDIFGERSRILSSGRHLWYETWTFLEAMSYVYCEASSQSSFSHMSLVCFGHWALDSIRVLFTPDASQHLFTSKKHKLPGLLFKIFKIWQNYMFPPPAGMIIIHRILPNTPVNKD